MILDIFRNSKHIGSLELAKDNSVTPISEIGGDFKILIDKSLAQGITRFRHVILANRRVIIEEPISKNNAHYGIAFKEWLIRYGYKAIVRHSEIDGQIKNLLVNIADGDSLKGKIETELPTMSYLEKSFILEQLKYNLWIPNNHNFPKERDVS